MPIDESVLANVRGAGRYRVNWLPEIVGPDRYESPYYRDGYLARGVVDAIFVGCPVNGDVEAYLGFQRKGRGEKRFDAEARAVVSYALRGLRWFHRQQLLNRGLLVTRSPLTEAERRVLHRLLTGESERRLSKALGLALPTAHNHISAICRKFGVRSRAGLMALWLLRTESHSTKDEPGSTGETATDQHSHRSER